MANKVYVVGVGMTKFEKPGRRKNDDGSESLVNFHIDAGELVVHRVGERFVLRRGQLVGCIVNKDYSGGGERLSNNVIAPGVERITKGDIQ